MSRLQRTRRATVATLALLLAGSASAQASDVEVAAPATTQPQVTGTTRATPASTSTPSRTTRSANTTSTTASPQTTSNGAGQLPENHREVVPAAIEDLNNWWATTFQSIYNRKFDPVTNITAARPGVTIPRCQGQGTGRYRDVQGNAFYCPGDDFIVYDDNGLFQEVSDEYGSAATAVVMAHEFGHAIQFRAGVDERTITMEQQADCFAGAWTAHAMNDDDATLRIPNDDLKRVLAAMISVADRKGVSAEFDGAHGSGFDRASAFQDGFQNGAKSCVRYPTDPPTVLEFPFVSVTDQLNEGNLPLVDTLDFMAQDLDVYWSEEFTAAGRTWTPIGPVQAADTVCKTATVELCDSAGKVAYDATFLGKVYRTGDFAVGLQFGLVWAEAALTNEGSKLSGKSRRLAADCYVGAWANGQLPQNLVDGDARTLSLSPGDLDEAVVSFLAQTDDGGDPVFERLTAFRGGLLGGRGVCQG